MSDTVIIAIITSGLAFLGTIAGIVIPLLRDRKHGWSNITKDIDTLKGTVKENGELLKELTTNLDNKINVYHDEYISKFDALSNEIKTHHDEFVSYTEERTRRDLKRLRGQILSFADEVLMWKQGIGESELSTNNEKWNYFMNCIRDYNDLCKSVGDPNHEIAKAMAFITDEYNKILF